MKNIHGRLADRKRRSASRLDCNHIIVPTERAVFSAKRIRYKFSERAHGIAVGGIGAMQSLAKDVEPAKCINQRVYMLKHYLPHPQAGARAQLALLTTRSPSH